MSDVTKATKEDACWYKFANGVCGRPREVHAPMGGVLDASLHHTFVVGPRFLEPVDYDRYNELQSAFNDGRLNPQTTDERIIGLLFSERKRWSEKFANETRNHSDLRQRIVAELDKPNPGGPA